MSDSCAACTGLCCYDVVVRVTGYDAWRIKRAQALPFEQFLAIGPDMPAAPGAFMLDGERSALYLGKNSENSRACTFLMHLSGGVQRCGIYANRPSVCAVYPMTFTNGSVALRSDVRCDKSNWNMATITYPRWRHALLKHLFETHLYDRVAAAWNEIPAAANPSLAKYYAYIERCFDAIDTMRLDAGEKNFDELILRWQQAGGQTSETPAEDFLKQVDRVSAAEAAAV
ncbi:MAG TPA: YkgJ family cysteine cluster protein [Candidatus Rubrimentiphilum sp.]|nr:YkgJ family cysteine cluster protein [Candidatus Rubrimentiphilum sp.]